MNDLTETLAAWRTAGRCERIKADAARDLDRRADHDEIATALESAANAVENVLALCEDAENPDRGMFSRILHTEQVRKALTDALGGA